MLESGNFYSLSEGGVIKGTVTLVERNDEASDRGHVEKTRALVAGEKVDVKGQVYELDAAESYSDVQRSTLMQEAALVGLYTSVGIFIGADSASAEFYAIAGYDAKKGELMSYATYAMKAAGDFYSVSEGSVVSGKTAVVNRENLASDRGHVEKTRALVAGEKVDVKGQVYELDAAESYSDVQRSTLMQEAALVGLYTSVGVFIGADSASAEFYAVAGYDAKKGELVSYATYAMKAAGDFYSVSEGSVVSGKTAVVNRENLASDRGHVEKTRALAAGEKVDVKGQVYELDAAG